MPIDIVHKDYMIYVRDQIAGPFILAQMKAGMMANGYSYEKYYPTGKSDINLLKRNSPYPMRPESRVPIPRSEAQATISLSAVREIEIPAYFTFVAQITFSNIALVVPKASTTALSVL